MYSHFYWGNDTWIEWNIANRWNRSRYMRNDVRQTDRAAPGLARLASAHPNNVINTWRKDAAKDNHWLICIHFSKNFNVHLISDCSSQSDTSYRKWRFTRFRQELIYKWLSPSMNSSSRFSWISWKKTVNFQQSLTLWLKPSQLFNVSFQTPWLTLLRAAAGSGWDGEDPTSSWQCTEFC